MKTFKEMIEFEQSPEDQFISQSLSRIKTKYGTKKFLYVMSPHGVRYNYQDTYDHITLLVRFRDNDHIYYENYFFEYKNPLISDLSYWSETKRWDKIITLYNKVKLGAKKKTSKIVTYGTLDNDEVIDLPKFF